MEWMVFDVGGTEIKYSVMNDRFQSRESGSVSTPMKDLDTFLETLKSLWRPHQRETAGIALSLPGFVDRKRGMVLGGGALAYNWGQAVGPKLSDLCGVPVRIANDGKCAVLAEWKAGALKGCSNCAVFVVGTGVGGGLVLNGRILEGSHGTAGEFSFVPTDAEHWREVSSMLAQTCSTTALLNHYRTAKNLPKDASVNGRELFAAFHSGDSAARQSVDALAENIAVQIYSLTVLLDLEKCAIGGGISRQPALIDAIREKTEFVFRESPGAAFSGGFPAPEVTACQFHNRANQIGALYYYLQDEPG